LSDVFKGWGEDNNSTFISKFGSKLQGGTSFKERLNSTVFKLKSQLDKLENATGRMKTHDKELFKKCVKSQISKDKARAVMYANECAELRKIMKTTLCCHLALEKVILRLETVREFGDIAMMMKPSSMVINSVKDQLSGIMPDVSYELNEIHESLDTLALDFGETSEISETSTQSGEEAASIIKEASVVAEQRMKEKFPEVAIEQEKNENKILEGFRADS
jgi:division protein CdvB (Snf7/Vps24/ESCRT-III family)